MIQTLCEMLSYPFMLRALTAGVLVAVCSAALGVTLVLRRLSMIGDGLSHVGFGALAIAAALSAQPLVIAIPVVMAAAFLLLRVSRIGGLGGDSAIALISTGSLAAGVIVISKTGANTDIYGYLFGSVLSLSRSDAIVCAALSAIALVVFIFVYNRTFAITFDEDFAAACGINTGLYGAVTALLTAVVIVVGMRMMGAMLISSLVIFPALTAMRVCGRFKTTVICSAIVGAVCFALGLTASYICETPASATIVAANTAAFAIFAAVGGIIRRG